MPNRAFEQSVNKVSVVSTTAPEGAATAIVLLYFMALWGLIGYIGRAIQE